MKRNVLPIICFVIAIVFITLAFTNCSPSTYVDVYSATYMNPDYAKWKAEQTAKQKAVYAYTQSDEFKKKYCGKSESNKLSGPAPKSVTGTANDPFKEVKAFRIGTPANLSTQYHSITIKY